MTSQTKNQTSDFILNSLPITLVLTTVALLLIFPVQDFDIFWHIANGKAMLADQSIINQEIFSYTANGNTFNNHAWLSQIFFYLVYDTFGANGLIVSKIILVSGTLFCIYTLGRKHQTEALPAALICLLVAGCSLFRYVVRPHLFSYLLLSGLAYILFSYRSGKHSNRILFLIPLLIGFWDILHGAIYGVIFIAAFCLGEIFTKIIAQRIPANLPTCENRQNHKSLWLSLAATLIVLLISPYGLRSYDIFLGFIDSNLMTSMTAEFQQTTLKDHPLFVVLFAITLGSLLINWRKGDITQFFIFIIFSYLAIRYVRAIGPFSVIAGSILMTTLPCTLLKNKKRWNHPFNLILLCILATGMSYGVHYKFSSPARYDSFGTGISNHAFPTGSSRFIKEANLTGNMYNTDRFGGYLASFLYPERLLFHYNHHMLFTALEQFVHEPSSRDKWQINYAIVGRADEWELFEKEGFMPVYWESTAAIMLRNSQANKEIIDRFAIKYFSPMLSKERILNLATNKTTLPRLVQETADYLSHRNDKETTATLATLITLPSQKLSTIERINLLNKVRKFNPGNPDINGSLGNLYYKNEDIDHAKKFIKMALATNNNMIQALFTMAYIQFDEKNYQSAISNFLNILAQIPLHPDSHYGLGLSYYQLGEFKQAQISWQKYLQIMPSGHWADKARTFLGSMPKEINAGSVD